MLSSGMRLGPYEIRSALGAGGMGEVYRAWDARLGREVAIKVLPDSVKSDPAAVARFEREARAVALLSHPNIVTIHDVGREGDEVYAVMELLEGQTLRERLRRGPLPPAMALNYATQVAEGMAAAHSRGIIHRDLKPENVFVTRDGRVKILDFGLARALDLAPHAAVESAIGTEEQTAQPWQTRSGVILGTLGYMPPEQLSGEHVDHRADIFSFGCVLYEMLAGARPFHGDSAPEMIAAILTAQPPSLDRYSGVHPSLARTVGHCLEKEADDRFQNMRDVLFALREQVTISGEREVSLPSRPPQPIRRSYRYPAIAAAGLLGLVLIAGALWLNGSRTPARTTSGGGAPSIRVLAVLPFASLSSNAEQEYLADGITEALITDLSRVGGLTVIARNTAFQYKGKTVDVREVGRELAVTHVLTGSVQQTGDRVRLNAQLVDTQSGTNVWSERLDRQSSDVFALQDDVASQIASALRPNIAATATPRHTPDHQAYDLYMRGLFHFRKQSRENREQAIDLITRSVARDPRFAPARAILGSAYTQKAFYDDSDRRWLAMAEEQIDAALALDPNLAEAYVARAQLIWNLQNGFPHEQALQALRRAVELNPSLAEAHDELGKVYYHIGLLDKALLALRETVRLDPAAVAPLRRITTVLFDAGRCKELEAEIERFTDAHERQIARASAEYCHGRYADAVALLQVIPPRPERAVEHQAQLARFLARAGRVAEARRMIDQTAPAAANPKRLSHIHHAQLSLASAEAVLNNHQQAIRWLQQCVREGYPAYPVLVNNPDLRALRGQPEFELLIRELGEQHQRWSRQF
jgi:eukaryotic-like serine/threonine-protein kinase